MELPPIAERRPKTRSRTLLGGVVVWNNGNLKLNCKIRDISESGARISVERGHVVPSHFFMINVRDGMAHESKVVWQSGDQIGMKFIRSFELGVVTEPSLIHLKKIWEQRATMNALWKA